MFWREWSDYTCAQVVNGLIIGFFVVAAWRMWAADNGLWTVMFLAAAVVNTVGAVWRARQMRRGVYGVERPPDSPAA